MPAHSKEIGTIILESELIANEVPTGDVNSINTTYVISQTPVVGTVQVYLNGSLMAPGSGADYIISGTTITFAKAPHTGSNVLVSYIKSS
jgi:hypothetical protein